MKVLWIIPGDGEGSSFIFSRRQIMKLKELGIDGYLYFLKSRTNLLKLLQSYYEIKKIIRAEKPDLVHAHYGSINGLFSVLLGLKRSIVTFQGSDLNHTQSVSWLQDFLSKKASAFVLRKSSCNIVVSDSLLKLIPGKYHFKCCVIPMGVDDDVFKPMDKKLARQKLGWQISDKVVIINGNNPVVKRTDIALKAIEIVRKVYPETRLEILGGSVNPEDIPYLLNASDVLLMCSDSEGSPTIIKEAMACNIPIVSNIVGDTYLRLHNVQGAILSNQHPDDLAAGLLSFLSIPNRDGFKLREAFFEQSLAETALCHKIIDIYKKIKS